jgi:dipeptidyl aminopeptidase/acylaminoacyl peptidase
MSVETRARQAAEGLRRASAFDVDSGLVRVRRTRRRRDLARMAAAAVVFAAVVGGVLAARHHDAAIEPITPVRNGEIIPPKQGEPAWEDFDQSTGLFLDYAAPADDVHPAPAGVFTVAGKDGEVAHFDCPFAGGCDVMNALGPRTGEVTTVDRASWELRVLGYDGATRDTLNLRDVVVGDVLSNVAWSPDGRRLAVSTACEHTSSACPSRVWIMDGGGGNPEVVYAEPAPTSGIAWSPDGRQLAVSTDCELPATSACPARVWLMDRDGRNARVIHSEPVPGAQVDATKLVPLIRELTWSPDEHSLAFIVHTDNCGAAIDVGVRPHLVVLMPQAEQAMRPQTLHVYDDIDCHGDLLPSHYPAHFNYAWSPDSSRLAVTSGDGFDEISATDGRVLVQHATYRGPGVDFVTGPLAWLRAP